MLHAADSRGRIKTRLLLRKGERAEEKKGEGRGLHGGHPWATVGHCSSSDPEKLLCALEPGKGIAVQGRTAMGIVEREEAGWEMEGTDENCFQGEVSGWRPWTSIKGRALAMEQGAESTQGGGAELPAARRVE